MFRSLLGSHIKTEILVFRRMPILFSLSVQNFRPKGCCVQKRQVISSNSLPFHSYLLNATSLWPEIVYTFGKKMWAFFWYQNLSWIYIRISKFRENLVVRGHRQTVCDLDPLTLCDKSAQQSEQVPLKYMSVSEVWNYEQNIFWRSLFLTTISKLISGEQNISWT